MQSNQSSQKQRVKTQPRTYGVNERIKQIDRENQMLFCKILDISTKPNRSNSTNYNGPFKTTLNFRNRKDFQIKIASENPKIFSRIQQQTSYYSFKKSSSKSLPKKTYNNQELLFQGQLNQDNHLYQIKIIIQGGLMKILASEEQHSYTRVLEMMKGDGLLLIRNVFNNDMNKLLQNLIINDKISIKGIQLVEGHGDFTQ